MKQVGINLEFAEKLNSPCKKEEFNPLMRNKLLNSQPEQFLKEVGFQAHWDKSAMEKYGQRYPEEDDDCFERMVDGLKNIES